MFFLRAGTEERDTQINITWFPLREINKSGGNKFVAPSKAYIKFQNIGKRSGTSFTSILRFFVVMPDRHESEESAFRQRSCENATHRETALSQAQKPTQSMPARLLPRNLFKQTV